MEPRPSSPCHTSPLCPCPRPAISIVYYPCRWAYTPAHSHPHVGQTEQFYPGSTRGYAGSVVTGFPVGALTAA